jgi:hypothetical protein
MAWKENESSIEVNGMAATTTVVTIIQIGVAMWIRHRL